MPYFFMKQLPLFWKIISFRRQESPAPKLFSGFLSQSKGTLSIMQEG